MAEDHYVLVVDDEPKVADLVTRALSVLDLEVRVAHTTLGAFRLLEEHPHPRLAFVDLKLGQGTGIQVIDRLRTGSRGVPVVVITGSKDYGELKRASGLDANITILRKPFGPDEVLAQARRFAIGV